MQISSDTRDECWEATNYLFPEITGRGADPDEACEDFCDKLNELWPAVNGVAVVH